jgi:signal peptidase I
MTKKFFVEIFETLLFSIIVLFFIYVFIALPEVVWGSSMEPNFYTGERILVEKITKHFRDYTRGEVVVLNPPGNSNADYLKRIVGVPGDILKIFDCEVYIVHDGVKYKLEEPYLADGTCTHDGTAIKEGRSFKIDDDYYVVLGDNRAVSSDSRYFGLVKRDKILGRVVFRFWPLDRLGFTN